MWATTYSRAAFSSDTETTTRSSATWSPTATSIVGGSGHLIKFNVIRTLNPRDNYGPFAPFFTSNITNQYGVFDGTNGKPNFVDRLAQFTG